MKRQYTANILRFVVYGILLILLFLVEETPNLLPRLFGATPYLLVCFAVALPVCGEGELTSLFFGVAAGLLLDYTRGGPFGLQATLLGVCCFFGAMLTQKLFRKTVLTMLLFSGTIILLSILLTWLWYYVLAGVASPGYLLVRYLLPSGLYTLLLALPLYGLVWVLRKVFVPRMNG